MCHAKMHLCGNVDYFELKATKTLWTQEKLLPPLTPYKNLN